MEWKFVVERECGTGYHYPKSVDNPNLDPLRSPLTVAHDVLEHPHAHLDGSIEEEIAAFGAIRHGRVAAAEHIGRSYWEDTTLLGDDLYDLWVDANELDRDEDDLAIEVAACPHKDDVADWEDSVTHDWMADLPFDSEESKKNAEDWATYGYARAIKNHSDMSVLVHLMGRFMNDFNRLFRHLDETWTGTEITIKKLNLWEYNVDVENNPYDEDYSFLIS